MTLDPADLDRLTVRPLPDPGVPVPLDVYVGYLRVILECPTLDDEDVRALIHIDRRKHGDR